jgi:hypothetical protein
VLSRDRVGVIRELIELWNRRGHRDLGDLSRLVDPGIELESPFASLAGEPYRGYAGIERWVLDIDEQFAEWSILADDVRQVGDRAVATATVHARGRGSDLTLQVTAASVWEFAADGRARRIHIYTDVQEALKLVGLEE